MLTCRQLFPRTAWATQSKGLSPAWQPQYWCLWRDPTVQSALEHEWILLTQLLIDDKHLKLCIVLKLLVNYDHSYPCLRKGTRELLPQRIWQDIAGASYCATPTSCRGLCVCRALPKSPWLVHTVNNTSGTQGAGFSQQEPPFVFITDTNKMELWSM